MISCNDLLSLNIFKNIKLVAGKNGIYKNISWPYVCQTLDFSQWINGGELMFLTGMGMDLDEEKIINLIYECVQRDISGLVILTHSEYISNISENMIKVADEMGLPLFDMPWKIKLINVTKEIANYIMELNLNQNKEKELLNELLFSQELDRKIITNLINQSKINIDSHVYVAKFKLLDTFNKDKVSKEYIINMLKSMLDKHNLKSILGYYDNDIVCILSLENRNEFIKHKSILQLICNQLCVYTKVSLSIGGIYENIFSARLSYEEATKSFKLYESNDWNLDFIEYDKIGFYKILFEVNNHDKLRNYCNSILGEILVNDKNLELLKTLRSYLRNNYNLINTSKELFIHRNTLIYRLNKIKDILNSNLEDQVIKNEFMNAIMIYDYLKYVDREK